MWSFDFLVLLLHISYIRHVMERSIIPYNFLHFPNAGYIIFTIPRHHFTKYLPTTVQIMIMIIVNIYAHDTTMHVYNLYIIICIEFEVPV